MLHPDRLKIAIVASADNKRRDFVRIRTGISRLRRSIKNESGAGRHLSTSPTRGRLQRVRSAAERTNYSHPAAIQRVKTRSRHPKFAEVRRLSSPMENFRCLGLIAFGAVRQQLSYL